MAQQKRLRLTTPPGRALWAHLHAPDTKFDPEGKYTVKLALSPSTETAEFLSQLDGLNDAAYAAAKKDNPKKKIAKHEPYEEQEDGTYILNFKKSYSGTRKDGSKWTSRLPVFDAFGNPAPDGLRVGNGSLIRVAFEPNEFYMPATKLAGVALSRMSAVQVIDLVEFGVQNADAYGFGAEEGSFAASSVKDRYEAEDEEEDEFEDSEDEEEEDEDEDADF